LKSVFPRGTATVLNEHAGSERADIGAVDRTNVIARLAVQHPLLHVYALSQLVADRVDDRRREFVMEGLCCASSQNPDTLTSANKTTMDRVVI
jgi:hypothetical protein